MFSSEVKLVSTEIALGLVPDGQSEIPRQFGVEYAASASYGFHGRIYCRGETRDSQTK